MSRELLAGIGKAVVLKDRLDLRLRQCGFFCSIIAATEATCGVAIDVPPT